MSVAQDIIQGLKEANVFELFKDTPIERVQQIAKAESEKRLFICIDPVETKLTNLGAMLEEIANTRIKSAFYKFPKRMVFVGDFAGEVETRKEAIEREIEWLKEEKRNA